MNILVLAEPAQLSYTYKLKELLTGHTVKVATSGAEYLALVVKAAQEFKSTTVVCLREDILKKLVQHYDSQAEAKDISTHTYRGSVFTYSGIDFLILPNPKILQFSGAAEWLFSHWLKKLTHKSDFPVFPLMDWSILTLDTLPEFYETAKNAILIAVDVETTQDIANPVKCAELGDKGRGIWYVGTKGSSKKAQHLIPKLTMVGYALLLKAPDGSLYSQTGVLRITSLDSVAWMRKLNSLHVPKVMQNGGYDCTYFLRYQAPMTAYLYDTFIFMHAWMVEFPRTLDFITSLWDQQYKYWKAEADKRPEEYNAKDCHNTLWSWVCMVQYLPQWAFENYEENFRMQFPCIHMGAEGWKVDTTEQARLKHERERKILKDLGKLETLIAPGFNPNSSPQTLKVMKGLGFSKAKSSDAATLQDFRDSHPIFDLVGSLISSVREDRKAVSTYFNVTLFDGRLLYELNPGGTDTGRLASKKSNLWSGTQIQNIPLYAKSMMVADEGWVLGSCDNAQSESRATAYISEDPTLMHTVETSPDFHKTNASLFFGLPFDEITKDVRTVSKRTNHGANYNMQEGMLLRTMGRKAVIEAQRLLKLPKQWSLRKVCAYLLESFDKTYPLVRGKYYDDVIREIQLTGKLVGATGWTRRCFGKPWENKPDLNSYVAHCPQSLSVKSINDALFDIWRTMAIGENPTIRLKAQVHDDIIWQCRPELAEQTKAQISERMAAPMQVKGRTLIIPNDPIVGARNWLELKD